MPGEIRGENLRRGKGISYGKYLGGQPYSPPKVDKNQLTIPDFHPDSKGKQSCTKPKKEISIQSLLDEFSYDGKRKVPTNRFVTPESRKSYLCRKK